VKKVKKLLKFSPQVPRVPTLAVKTTTIILTQHGLPMHHILVVDDDEEITALLTQYLTRFGYATYAACDGDSMRAQLAAQPIDLVVLDVMLPGVDGIRLAQELRSHSQLPIIMLTARSNPFDCVLGLELGPTITWASPSSPVNWWHASRTCCGTRPPRWLRRSSR
jgi:CheY-like chemotaxis protein